MFGSGKKAGKRAQMQDKQREEDLQHLRARYAAYEEEYRDAGKITDLGQRYLSLQALVSDIKEDLDLIREELLDGRKIRQAFRRCALGAGGAIAGVAGSVPLIAIETWPGIILASASMAVGLVSGARLDIARVDHQKKYETEMAHRQNFFNATELLIRRIEKDYAALPVEAPFRFAKSAFFDDVVEREPHILQAFNREALRERLKAAVPKPKKPGKKNPAKKNPGLEL